MSINHEKTVTGYFCETALSKPCSNITYELGERIINRG